MSRHPSHVRRFRRVFIKPLAALWLTCVCAAAGAADGEYDPAFGDGGRLLIPLVVDYPVARLHVLSDGSVLLGGTCRVLTFSGSGTSSDHCLARLRPDGQGYDARFGPSGAGYVLLHGFAGTPAGGLTLLDFSVLADDRIVTLSIDWNTLNVLLTVLKADGSALDPAVGNGRGWVEFSIASFSPRSVAVQSDGKLLMAGSMFGPKGNLDMAVARVLADFSALDSMFGNSGVQTIAFDLGTGASGSGDDVANALTVQADGKILLAGEAVQTIVNTPTYAKTSAVALARLTTDGLPDTSFGPAMDGRVSFGPAAVNAANAVLTDRLGRIVIGGNIANSDTVAGYQWLVERLLPDGSADPAFNSGSSQTFLVVPTATNGYQSVNALAIQSDGKILAAGTASRAGDPNGNQWWGAARFTPDGALDSGFGYVGRSYGSFTPAYLGCCGVTDAGSTIAVGDGGIVIVGTGQARSTSDPRIGVARLLLDEIFVDGFEVPL